MITYNKIFKNNAKWIIDKKKDDPDYFTKLSKVHKPKYLYIGCSDSRVPAEDLMGVKPGEIFIHRNIANIISNSDLNAMSVIEYAVSYLKVERIMVCGHYDCNGIKAAMQQEDLGLINPWLKNIRDVHRLHKDELNLIHNEEARYKRLIELNVEEQCINIIKTAVVQKEFLKAGRPIVHGWVFDVKSGRLIDLEIDFNEKFKNLQDIYHLKA